MIKLILFSFLILLSSISLAQNEAISHELKGKIIRSNAHSNGAFLVGIKDEQSGSGKVQYKAADSSNWAVLNDGKALCDSCTDVQTVAFANDTIFLAGTWKNGLYRSTDKGASWSLLKSFPAKDIRAVRVSESHPDQLFAATTTHGVLKSTDLGATWNQCSSDSLNKLMPCWSMEVDPENPKILYALTYNRGILRTSDQGETWKSVLKHENYMFYDLSFSENHKLIIAGGANDSLGTIFTSSDGEQWSIKYSREPARINSIALSGKKYPKIICGSWDKGIHFTPIETHMSIADIYVTKKTIFIYTWGDGIYTFENKWYKNKKPKTGYHCLYKF